jgi:hypothetical protein
MVESGEVERVVMRAPRGFGNIENFNNGFVIIGLADWGAARAPGRSWTTCAAGWPTCPGCRPSR